MKIKRLRVFNLNENEHTPVGHYAYYRNRIVKCIEGDGSCVGCCFSQVDNGCSIGFPELDMKYLECAYFNKDDKTIYRKYIYED